MKVEEIKLAFETNIHFALIDDVSAFNSQVTAAFLNGKSLSQQAEREYAKAAQLAAQGESLANKGILAAKELGAVSLEKELNGWKKGYADSIKRANKAETSLKGIS